jgi:hypothetical protein
VRPQKRAIMPWNTATAERPLRSLKPEAQHTSQYQSGSTSALAILQTEILRSWALFCWSRARFGRYMQESGREATRLSHLSYLE